MSQSEHIAVMTNEVMDALQPHAGGRYVDGTLGGGTHSRELLVRSAPGGRVLSFDLDRNAIERMKASLTPEQSKRWIGAEANFRDMAQVIERESFSPIDGIVIDLGLSSDELSDPARGFSFMQDGPLDMRLGQHAQDLTAAGIVNSWKEHELAEIIRDYGEERMARRIAEVIVKARKSEKIYRTAQLADIVVAALPRSYEHGRIHPATRTFQALRIAVNDELGALKEAIVGAREVLRPGGRLAIISFHSLEDRIVKQAFKGAEDLNIITKKPLIPTEEERQQNPRSRSAKLRIAEKKG
ncbi:16S rRNA (cytosine(1402)-N(4))-methyltransferase RsmH [Patescibacteria group bacterium]|nr:16S rRNA (cytosine(1402)-N(4))-methyltransferase RsmH [Patescibacteria group bacterium]